ncbi:MAG: hypothetical protein O3A21_09550, partial [Proteobacteria bacterium]|nr:hypothetical protein [Pseudomonadota bacterium]
ARHHRRPRNGLHKERLRQRAVSVQIKSPFKKADQRAEVTRYLVSVDVRGKDRLPLWRGTVETEASGADRYRVVRGMLTVLLERIGKAIENEIIFIN